MRPAHRAQRYHWTRRAQRLSRLRLVGWARRAIGAFQSDFDAGSFHALNLNSDWQLIFAISSHNDIFIIIDFEPRFKLHVLLAIARVFVLLLTPNQWVVSPVVHFYSPRRGPLYLFDAQPMGGASFCKYCLYIKI